MNRLLMSAFKNKPFHAYIYLGQENEAEKLLLEFINNFQIKSVDIFVLDPIEKIKIKEIRELQHQLSLKPHSSKFKLVVIKKAEYLTIEASNALLKTLEEPAKNSVLILFVSNDEAILPTIISRCQKIRIAKPSKSEVNSENEIMLKEIFKMSVKDKFDLANKLYQEKDLIKILDDWIIVLRREMLQNKKHVDIIKNILKSRTLLKQNVNIRLLLENLFLQM